MCRLVSALVVVLALAGCTDAAVDWSTFPAANRAVSVHLDVAEVDVGSRFTVTVDRVQPRGETAIDFDPQWLAPLALGRPTRIERTTAGRREERLVFPAYATAPGELSLPRELTVGTEPELQRLVVRSVLPADDAGILEPPPLPGASETPYWPWLAVAVVGAGVVLVVRGRRRETIVEDPPAEPVVERPDPARVLTVALADLNADQSDLHDRLSDALRTFAGAVAGIPHHTATDQQLVAALAGDPRLPTLEALLDECERVRFGGDRVARPPGAEALSRARDLAGTARGVPS